MSSSSEESDNENLKRIIESTDVNFLPESLYGNSIKNDSTKSTSDEKGNENETIIKNDVQKSQRYLEESEEICDYVKISQSMQDHLYKRLSSIIADKVKFIDVDNKEKFDNEAIQSKLHKKRWKSRVKLLKDSDVPIKSDIEIWENLKYSQKKPEIKRRKIEEDDLSEHDKIATSALDVQLILNGTETKSWTKRKEKSNKFFRYKTSKTGDTLHYLEPENEFSKLRKKNCWSEKYIAQYGGAEAVKKRKKK